MNRYTPEEQYAIIGSQHDPAAKPKKKKRVFMWTFLVVQALFVLWLVTGISGVDTSGSNCGGGLDAKSCADATAAGAGIGVMLILVLWCIVDFLLLAVWAVTRLARRR